MMLQRIVFSLIGLALLIALVSAGAVASLDESPPTEAAEQTTTDREEAEPSAGQTSSPQPVILRVNRNLDVLGHVELEDDDVIVVRTLRGRLESFAKTRVLQIVRLVDPEPGQRGIVYLRNGQIREGVIIDDTFDHVTMEISGIRARLRRETVDFVVLKPTFEQQYREFKATIGPRMHDRHLLLCRWLVDNRMFELARQELLELIESTEQEVPEARNMLRLVEAQLAIQAAGIGAVPTETESGEASSVPREREIDRGRILTHEEINLIRVYEIDFDEPPRVAVGQDTIRRMIEGHSENPLIPATQAERAAMFRADPLEIVRLMFKLRARDLYGEIQVLTEPASLNLFRRRVHDGWLMQTCATSACHGGNDAGDLFLHRSGHLDERVRYTNLLILERLDVHPQHRLINYEDPEISLLIQYALPRNVARTPHPDVRGWKPVFTRSNDRMKQETIRWIKSMMQPRPQYPIEFEPPRRERSDEPSTGGRIAR